MFIVCPIFEFTFNGVWIDGWGYEMVLRLGLCFVCFFGGGE